MDHETPSDANNPYRSPATVSDDKVTNRDERLRAELGRFHSKMRATGIGWVAFGAVALLVGLLLILVYSLLP